MNILGSIMNEKNAFEQYGYATPEYLGTVVQSTKQVPKLSIVAQSRYADAESLNQLVTMTYGDSSNPQRVPIDSIASHVVKHPNTSPETINRLVAFVSSQYAKESQNDASDWAQEGLAMLAASPMVSTEQLDQISEIPILYYRVQRSLAANPNASRTLLEAFSKAGVGQKLGVLYNPNAPEDLLFDLLNSSEQAISLEDFTQVANPTDDLIYAILRKSKNDPSIRVFLSSNPNVSPEVLRELCSYESSDEIKSSIYFALSANVSTPSDLLPKLISYDKELLYSKILRNNHDIPEHLIDSLHGDESYDLILNPMCPEHALVKTLKSNWESNHGYILSRALRHPRLPTKTMIEAFGRVAKSSLFLADACSKNPSLSKSLHKFIAYEGLLRSDMKSRKS